MPGDQCRATTAPSAPVPPVISTVPSGVEPRRAGVSTILPTWRAWLTKRNASGARRTSHAVDRRRRQRPVREQREYLGKHLADPLRRRALDRSNARYRRRVPATSSGSRMSVLPISTNRPPRGSSAQRGVHELAGQAVQHDVDPSPPVAARNSLVESRSASDAMRVRRRSPAPRSTSLLGRARRGEHLRAEVPGELDGGHADPAGGGVHQHPLARAATGEVHQAVVRGQEHDRHRRRLLERPAVRHAPTTRSSATALGPNAPPNRPITRSPGAVR